MSTWELQLLNINTRKPRMQTAKSRWDQIGTSSVSRRPSERTKHQVQIKILTNNTNIRTLKQKKRVIGKIRIKLYNGTNRLNRLGHCPTKTKEIMQKVQKHGLHLVRMYPQIFRTNEMAKKPKLYLSGRNNFLLSSTFLQVY